MSGLISTVLVVAVAVAMNTPTAVHAEARVKIRAIPMIDPIQPADSAVYQKISFSEAVRFALARNVSAIVASEEVNRAQALLMQARSGSLPSLVLNGLVLRTDGDRMQDKELVTPRAQQFANATLSLPLVAPRAWMDWSEASRNVRVAKASGEDARRTLAVAVARSYLAIIALKRQVDTTVGAVANDRSHYDYTHARSFAGAGSRVDEVRAAQQLAGDEVALSSIYTALARAREALSVLVGREQPVDTFDEVDLPESDSNVAKAESRRQDVLAAKQRALASQKLKRDSWTDFMPTVTGEFQKFYQNPSSQVAPKEGWQAMLVLTFPLFEGGLRVGQMQERDALMVEARAQYQALLRQTRSDLRVAVEEIHRADEAMRVSSIAADLAHQVLDLANLAYRAGAAAGIEVIDAERRARDADTAAVVAEDGVRQARLDLLVAAGQFP
jgi:outer membrane protein